MITASRPDAPNKPATHRRRRRSRTGPRGGPGNAARATRAPPAYQAPARGPRRGPPDAAAPDPSRCGSGSESLRLRIRVAAAPVQPQRVPGAAACRRHGDTPPRACEGGSGRAGERAGPLPSPSPYPNPFSIIRVFLYYPSPFILSGSFSCNRFPGPSLLSHTRRGRQSGTLCHAGAAAAPAAAAGGRGR